MKELSSITDPVVLLEKLSEFVGPILMVSVLNLFFTTILQYYIIYNPLDNGNNIFVSVVKSLKYFIPYLIIMVLLAFAGSIAIVLGILALVIGVFFSVLYIMMLYFFVLPVLIVEGPGIATVIRRTITLAHRNFWSNIGWVAVFIIILIVISVVFSGIVMLPFTGNFIKTIMNPADASTMADMTTNPLFIILSAVARALTLPLMPIFSCVLYFNGRAGEEFGETMMPVNEEHERVRVEDLYAKPRAEEDEKNV